MAGGGGGGAHVGRRWRRSPFQRRKSRRKRKWPFLRHSSTKAPHVAGGNVGVRKCTSGTVATAFSQPNVGVHPAIVPRERLYRGPAGNAFTHPGVNGVNNATTFHQGAFANNQNAISNTRNNFNTTNINNRNYSGNSLAVGNRTYNFANNAYHPSYYYNHGLYHGYWNGNRIRPLRIKEATDLAVWRLWTRRIRMAMGWVDTGWGMAWEGTDSATDWEVTDSADMASAMVDWATADITHLDGAWPAGAWARCFITVAISAIQTPTTVDMAEAEAVVAMGGYN